MAVFVRLIEFKQFDYNKIIDFLNKHKGVQLVNSKFFVGEKQAASAVNQMKLAFKNRSNFSKKEEIEFLVRFLGERQITKAMQKAKPGKKSVFVSWHSSKRNYGDFKKEFEFKIVKMPRIKEKELKEAIEKTASFWVFKK